MTFKSFCCGVAALFAIGLTNAGATPFTFGSGDTPVAIPDAGSASSTITVTNAGRVIDINALVNISHTWDADLVLTLSHNGVTVLLSNQNGGGGADGYADYANTLFDDSALIPINRGDAYPPYTGSFQPEQALSAFNDMDIVGDWTLTAADLYEEDTGTINNWSLQAEVPEPASLALFGLGLMGLARNRRRRK